MLHLYTGTKPRSGKLHKTSVGTPVHWGVTATKLEAEVGGRSNSSLISVLLKVSLQPLKADVSWTDGEDSFLRGCIGASLQQLCFSHWQWELVNIFLNDDLLFISYRIPKVDLIFVLVRMSPETRFRFQ